MIARLEHGGVRANPVRAHTAGILVELVGPAGAGKSTLMRALARRDGRIQPEIQVHGLAYAPTVARRALARIPVALDLALRAPRFLWQNARHLARLEGLDAIVRAYRPPDDRVVVFAEGPLFLLTRLLLAAEQQATTAPRFRRMWDDGVTRWTRRLDLVVWLDAPDDVLVTRIRERQKAHRLKAAGNAAIRTFLAEYRRAYRHVLAACAPADRARLLVLDSATTPVDELANAVLTTLPGDMP